MTRYSALLVVLLCSAPPAWADPDALDEALAKAAPGIVKQLREEGCRSVGVLKFLVQRPQKEAGEAADAVGELNQGLADRLENAMIFANTDERLGIIRGATKKAQTIPLANHLKEEGRKNCFEARYELAWGSAEVEPGAFITGRAVVAKDLKTVTLYLERFDKDGKVKSLGDPIEVPVTRRTLVEAGYSYVLTKEKTKELRGARGSASTSDDPVKISEIDQSAATSALVIARPAGVKYTAEDAIKESPVQLTCKYNGQPIKVEGGRLPEPGPDDKVSFTLKNTDPDATYAVVLKVNGRNTLFREEAEPSRCLKWILAPQAEVEVAGFQESDTKMTEFKILSDEESEADVIRYGDLVGSVRMVVFRGEQSAAEKADTPPAPRDLVLTQLVAISRGAEDRASGSKPSSLAGLQDLLRKQCATASGARGVIGSSDKAKEHMVERVPFKPLPSVGVADITIRYYTPKK
jgi:hypothetical protein